MVNFDAEADRIEALVRSGRAGFHCRKEMMETIETLSPVPIFSVNRIGGEIVPIITGGILHAWETDDSNSDTDMEFIEAMKQTDHPPGSFFVLIYPTKGNQGHGRYYWRLCKGPRAS